jgi:thioesterase domain-containing protein
MRSRRAFLSALAAFSVGVAGAGTFAGAETQVPLPTPRPQKAPNPKAVLPTPPAGSVAAGTYTNGRLILLRGLYNFFSRGMDAMAVKFKALGVPVILDNHSHWQSIADRTIRDYKADKNVAPIIIVGHSLGGDAALVMSNWMAQNGVPVRFIVVFDAVAQTHPIIGGVEEVLNYYKPKGYGQDVKAAPSFKGKIENIDLTERKDIDHLNIDKIEPLQEEVIARVMAILDAANPKAQASR